MEDLVAPPLEGTKPAFKHVYDGHFKDKNSELRAAGILTYGTGHSMNESLRNYVNSAPSKILPAIEKFHHYEYPDIGEIRVHYGRANDPKYYQIMTHGMKSDDKSFKAKDCVNPLQLNKCETLKNQLSESIYKSNKSAPLGRVPFLNLPSHIDPYTDIFGKTFVKDVNARETVNPEKPRSIVELEASHKHDNYIISHSDYEPGERKNRKFSQPFDENRRYGLKTEAFYDGRMAKKSLSWLPQTQLEKRTQNDSKLLDEFKEKHSSQIGQCLDPNKNTRFVGPDHTFGLLNTNEQYGAADIIHSRTDEKTLRGKDRERAFLASLRSHLKSYNYTKFKSLADAFKFYDKDKDGFISKDELGFACAATNYPVADELLDSLFDECDIDKDGKINFLEFSNFLCFKDSMKIGLKPVEEGEDANQIKDDEGRVLMNQRDLESKHNIAVNDIVPKTLSKQIDTKVGNWKTTYDIINEAPFKYEPLKKRVYGIPSIRNDLIAPTFRKIQDKKNYGADGTIWSLISPSKFTIHGVYESDALKPRSKLEISTIFKNIGLDLPVDLFELIWNLAKSENPYGEVSVEEFRLAYQKLNSNNLKSGLVSA